MKKLSFDQLTFSVSRILEKVSIIELLLLSLPRPVPDPDIWFDAVRMSDGTWILDVNNPTDRARTGTFSWHPDWPGRGKLPDAVTLPPGGRQQFTIKEGK